MTTSGVGRLDEVRRRSGGRVIAVGVAVAVLLVGIGLQTWRWGTTTSYVPPAPLAQLIPARVAGWNVEDTPLAEGSAAVKATLYMLNFDDYVCRTYRRGGTELQVFVAYWRPNSMPPAIVAQHTPDTCWVAQGMILCKSEHAVPIDDGAGHVFPDGEFRSFTNDTKTMRLNTVYWHIVGRTISGARRAGLSLLAWWCDALKRARAGAPSQYFIRLTFNRPLREMEKDAGWRAVVAELGKFGLAPESAPDPQP